VHTGITPVRPVECVFEELPVLDRECQGWPFVSAKVALYFDLLIKALGPLLVSCHLSPGILFQTLLPVFFATQD